MFDLILACTKSFGIGKDNHLPWRCDEELKIFRKKTANSVLIVGRKTAETLPNLSGREILILSKTDSRYFSTVESALEYSTLHFPDRKVFIAGGAEIYEYCLKNCPEKIGRIHISILDQEFSCDTFVNIDFRTWVIESENKEPQFTHMVLKYVPNGEGNYLQLLEDIMKKGAVKKGRNGYTKSLFGKHLTFDVSERFPLLSRNCRGIAVFHSGRDQLKKIGRKGDKHLEREY